MSKSVLITGITGQDGAYLAKFLLAKGYTVYGGYHYTRPPTDSWRLKLVGIDQQIEFVYLNLQEPESIEAAVKAIKPDEIYNLAAQSSVGKSFQYPKLTSEVSGFAVLHLLESIRKYAATIRFYQASSSEMFGAVKSIPQHEETPFYPQSPYAVAKQFAHCLTLNYREAYDLYACSGIVFNHESPLRSTEYVSRKITHSVARIHKGLLDSFSLGNIDIERDWGFAGEYVEAMWMMLQQQVADDYVISSGETHSIREFVQCAFSHVNIPIAWEGKGINEVGIDRQSGKTLVTISPKLFRPAEGNHYVGDHSKASEKLGWRPRTSFRQLVELMVQADLDLLSTNGTH